ncbi:MAG TPA: helix-turn-helix transcriptional regulator [Candidatus Eisenbacteria bacterium]|nr:helix-turn-helix transcriptional regulator [Candidatus Eisenbacteria bacterium]
MSKSDKEIGKKLKIAREKLELTQAEVADKVGMHVNSYAKLERGEVGASIDTLSKLAKTLKIKSSDILPF